MDVFERENLALVLYEEKRYDEAERLLQQLSNDGSTYSLLLLGCMHQTGAISSRVKGAAKFYFERAGLAGNAESYLRLGCLLENQGDSARARPFRKAPSWAIRVACSG